MKIFVISTLRKKYQKMLPTWRKTRHRKNKIPTEIGLCYYHNDSFRNFFIKKDRIAGLRWDPCRESGFYNLSIPAGFFTSGTAKNTLLTGQSLCVFMLHGCLFTVRKKYCL